MLDHAPALLADAAVLDIVDVGLVACDATGHLTLFNRASRDFHGLDADGTVDPVRFAEAFDLYDVDGRPLPPEQVPLTRALTEGSVTDVDIVIAPRALPARTVSCSGRRVTGADGSVLGAVVWMHDVTTRQADLRALADSEQLFRTVFMDSPLGLAISDEGGRLLDVNPALCRMLDLAPGQLLDDGLVDHQTGASAVREHRQPGEVVQERLLRTGAHTGLWTRIVRSEVTGPCARRTLLLQVEDVARARRSGEQPAAVNRDGLTGLANRVGLTEDLTTALQGGSGVSLMFVDLDDFKVVNDTYGHGLGDAVLAEVARRLTAVLRGQDTVARLGGDEFVLLCRGLDGTDHREADAVAGRVLGALSAPYVLGRLEIPLSASVGISHATPGVASADLLGQADAAMYAAKRAGKNQVATHHPSSGHIHIGRAHRAERLLRAALNRGTVVVHYQPVVDLSTGLVVGVEALARVPDDGDGLLPPAEFIPVAERTGLVGALGAAVLEQAVHRTAAWKALLPPDREFGCGVNLSVRQLDDPNLIGQVQSLLAGSGLPADALNLELTESVFSDSDEHAMVLRRLSSLGARIVIDDFGTGFSSLSYLRRFPVDGIKIDRSFVADLAHDRRDRTVTRALVGLGQDLGVPVIAEGIEDHQQLGQLQDMGPMLGQGYLLSRPVAAEQIDDLLVAPLATFSQGDGRHRPAL